MKYVQFPIWYISDQIGEKWKIKFLYLLVKYNYNEKKRKKDILKYYNEKFKY